MENKKQVEKTTSTSMHYNYLGDVLPNTCDE